METIKIKIPIEPKTKKNSQRIHKNYKTGKTWIAPSEAFKQYERDAGYFVNRYSRLNINEPVNIECHFYMKTRRLCDLTNLLEAIDDVLVAAGVLSDDNYNIVAGHDGSRVHYDKDNPRTEIIITSIAPESGKIDASARGV